MPNSQVYQFHMAMAAELALFYLTAAQLRTGFAFAQATGDDADERVLELPLSSQVRRLGPQHSVGKVAFFRAAASPSTITIPAGTLVKFDNGQSASTIEAAVITPTSAAVVSGHGVGRDSGIVLAVSLGVGSVTNVDIASVVGLGSPIPGVAGVVGMAPFRGGSDREPDGELLARGLDALRSLAVGSPTVIEAATRGVADPLTGKQAKFVKLAEDLANPGVSYLYVDDGEGHAADFGDPVTDLLVASALGGETLFQVSQWPVSTSPTAFILTKNTLPLVLGQDYFFRPTDGLIRLSIPLDAGDTLSASYKPYTGLLKTVQKVVDGDPSNPVLYPGVRAAGSIVRALPAIRKSLTIVGTVVMDALSQQTKANLDNIIPSQTISYVQTLGIEEEFVPSELVRLLKSITGVHDVVLSEVNDGVTTTVVRKRPPPFSVFRTDASLIQIQVVVA